MDAIYRFRSADKLLDEKYDEFTHIYLADRESLNDPMEGFFNIIFKGDETLWGNLFKHFYQSIWIIWTIMALKHGRHDLGKQDVIIGNGSNWSDDFFYKEAYSEFESYWLRFCDTYEMNTVFERFEKCSCPINVAILEIALQVTAPFAMHHVGLLGDTSINPQNSSLHDFLEQLIDSIETYPISNECKHDLIAGIAKNIGAKYHFDINIPQNLSKNNAFLLLDFTNIFMDRLLYLSTPYVHLASFSKKFDHPLTWSHYADGNKGVCLIFDKSADYTIQKTNEKLRFHPVFYDLKTTELNFFSTIFRINSAQAINRWQSGGLCPEKGSKLFDRILYPYFHKLGVWEYEAEERLLVDDFMRDEPFQIVGITDSHLKGVIFGGRMHYNQEIEIRNKAKGLGLNSLKFYHAVWSEHNQGIKVFDENGNEYTEEATS